MLLVNFSLSILSFGLSVRAFERYLLSRIHFSYRAFYEDEVYVNIATDEYTYQNYNYVWNSFWLIVVTMTTGTEFLNLTFFSWFRRLVPNNTHRQVYHSVELLLGHVHGLAIRLHSASVL